MRWVVGVLALSLAACVGSPPGATLTSDELCPRVREIVAGTACCGATPTSSDLTELGAQCDTIRALVDDPRVGLDGAAASEVLDELERRLDACDPGWAAWAASAEGLRRIYRGTRGLGTPCDVASGTIDAATILSCAGGYCPTRTDELATMGTCAPYRTEGASCASDLECAPGLFCAPGAGMLGACTRPRPLGSACRGFADCASGDCASGVCTAPSSTRPETICAPSTPPPTDRDVDLVLSDFTPSATRTVTLRVLDAAGTTQLTVLELVGLSSAASMHHIPAAVPPGDPVLVQAWTEDASSPTPERLTWERPVATTSGAITVTIAQNDATTPLTAMPPPSLDALFELDLLSFDLEVGKTFQLRLLDGTRTVGQTRLDTIEGASFRVDLPDTVVPGVRYEFRMYVDENGDGAYQPPPTDHAWRALATAPGTGGLSLPYAWSSMYQDVAF